MRGAGGVGRGGGSEGTGGRYFKDYVATGIYNIYNMYNMYMVYMYNNKFELVWLRLSKFSDKRKDELLRGTGVPKILSLLVVANYTASVILRTITLSRATLCFFFSANKISCKRRRGNGLVLPFAVLFLLFAFLFRLYSSYSNVLFIFSLI